MSKEEDKMIEIRYVVKEDKASIREYGKIEMFYKG